MELANPRRMHLHVLISPELMQFLKDTTYLRSRGGERITQQDLVNEILERYHKEHREDLLVDVKLPRQAAGCNSSA